MPDLVAASGPESSAVGLDQACGQGQLGQVSAAGAAGLVPDPVQVRADRTHADERLGGDLGVGAAQVARWPRRPLAGMLGAGVSYRDSRRFTRSGPQRARASCSRTEPTKDPLYGIPGG